MECESVQKTASGNMSEKHKDLQIIGDTSVLMMLFEIRETFLYTSLPVYTLMHSYGCPTALGLIGMLESGPTAFVVGLGWTYEQVKEYHSDLTKACKLVGVSFPERTEPFVPRGMGAMAPPGSEWMIGRTVEQIEKIRAEAEAAGKPASEIANLPKWKPN